MSAALLLFESAGESGAHFPEKWALPWAPLTILEKSATWAALTKTMSALMLCLQHIFEKKMWKVNKSTKYVKYTVRDSMLALP